MRGGRGPRAIRVDIRPACAQEWALPFGAKNAVSGWRHFESHFESRENVTHERSFAPGFSEDNRNHGRIGADLSTARAGGWYRIPDRVTALLGSQSFAERF